MSLTAAQLKTLSSVCDTLIPASGAAGASAFDALSASSLAVDKALAGIIDSNLEPSLRSQFHRLLRILDGRAYNLILAGRLDRFSEEVRRRGMEYNKVMLFSAHLMGTCRMSSSPDRGPVKPTEELHSVENLFIGDGSVFPTSLGANPIITIMAMAARTADEIARRLSEP